MDERATVLARLHREVAGCRRCVAAGFIPTAHAIFKGEIGNRVMVVGQAPGALAHERPAPYMGATGRTLRAWLARAGFAPEALHDRFYLTSLTKCFPGASASGKGDRAPSAAEVALCRGHLDRELALVRPELVLALGRLAATALVGPAPLAELVGTVREAERAGHRFLVLPLPHPSGVSRWLNDPANRARHEQALALLAEPKKYGNRAAPKPPLKELGTDPDSGGAIVVKEGRFGAYVTDGETNATLRKGDDIETLTHERAVDLLAEKRAKGPAPKKKAAARKAPAKKAAAKKAPAKKAAAKKA